MGSKNLHKNYKSKYKTSTSYTNVTKHSKLSMLPIIFVFSILPFIMHLHDFNTGLSDFTWYHSSNTQLDIFLYYKQIFFIGICFIMMILILMKIYKDQKSIKFSPIFIPLFLYGVLALLSTLFSDYPSFGFKGIAEQFESILVILGYCLVVYYAYLFIETEDDLKFLLKYFLIGVIVMVLLGVLQVTGNDLFATTFGKKLYIPKLYWDELDNFTLTFGPKRVYLTLYNPNYVGVYVSLILPFIMGLMITERKIKSIILYVVAMSGLMISIIGSESKAGFISLFVALFIALILYRRYIFRNIKMTLLLISIVIITFIGFKSVILSTINKAFSNVNILFGQKNEYSLTDIKTEDVLTITYKGNNLMVDMEQSERNVSIIMTDRSGNDVASTMDTTTGTFTITDERFSGIKVTPILNNSVLCTQVNIEGRNWIFSNQLGDGSYYYLNYFGKFDKIKKAESSLFTGYERFASGRGYIWSRTIPLLKDNIILGSGADTFTTQFPHQDYVYRTYMGYDTQIMTKPHSLYLQIGVQSGVISLIAFLAFFISYFISSIRIYINGRFDNYFKRVGVAIFIGVVAYMVSGISNDSTITVAPVAWALIGIGVACNYKVKEQISK